MHVAFSMEHKVHLLEFTKENSDLTFGKFIKHTNFLDNTMAKMQATYDLDYYLKIVGTKYENIFIKDMDVYQFTALKSSSMKTPMTPAVSFKYEFDPVSMRYHWKNATLT